MSSPPKDLFKRFDTPPSPTHDAVQKWARHEGWTAPWDRKQQRSEAGKKSGLVRAARERLRRDIVSILYGNLDSAYRNQPFSTKSIKALHDEYLKVLHREREDNVLDAAVNRFSARELIEAFNDIYQKGNFLDVMSNMIFSQKDWSRDPCRVRFIQRTCLDLHRLSETDLRFLSRASRETLKKDLKSMNVRGRQRTRRSG
jgi:hypothetical protein